MAPTETNN